MFAKVIIISVALAVVHSSIIAPVGYGATVLTSAPLVAGKGLIAVPSVATVSSQKSVINHVAPAGHVAVAPASIALASHGIVTNGLTGGYGTHNAPLGIRSGLGAPIALGVGSLGHSAVVSSQKSVINHVAPSAPISVAAAPLGHANHGIVGGYGIAAAPLAIGADHHGAPIALGVAVGNLGLGHAATVSSQKSVINHVAPAAPVTLATHGIYGNGIVSRNALLSNGLVGGHGIAAAPLAIGKGLLGAPGHGSEVSSQKSVISHVAPVPAPVAVAAAPITLASHGIYGNGIVSGNGPLANGLVGGHGIAATPLAIGKGLLVSPIGHGSAVSSQKSVISHVAPTSHVAVAASPVTLANTGIISNGLIGGHGIVGNGLIAGSPVGIAGHGISSLPLSIGSGIHGSLVAPGIVKSIL